VSTSANIASKTILVVGNETLAGRELLDAVKERADPDTRFILCVPQNRPRSGLVIYDDAVFDAAQVRADLALEVIRDMGVRGIGEVGDPDPFTAALDAVREYRPQEIIVSTYPETRSGWLRRDLVERIRTDSGLPVTHVVVDLDADRAHRRSTLVVANQTVGGQPLIDLLKEKAQESPHRFIVITPQSDGSDAAADRLAHTLSRLREAGLDAIGQVGDPDPFTAIQNALQWYVVDEIVISTFPGERSGWLRMNLIERTKAATGKPVEHIEISQEAAQEGAAA
jgi:hypothetical protein